MIKNHVLIPSIRALASMVLRSGTHARLSILIYHRVLSQADPVLPQEVHIDRFKQHMKLVAAHFNVLPLSVAIERLRAGTLPRRALAITFDDGYLDNHNVALPILRRWNLPTTFFITTKYLSGSCMWNDALIESLRYAPGPTLNLQKVGLGKFSISSLRQRQQALNNLLTKLKYLSPEIREDKVSAILEQASVIRPTGLMMTPAHVRNLHVAGHEIGGHTVSHPILTSVDLPTARSEIADGKQNLEEITGSRIRLFAYPNGKPGIDYDANHVNIVKSLGFEGAVSTSWGTAARNSDPYQLPRFTPWDKSPARFMLRLLQNALLYKTSTV